MRVVVTPGASAAPPLLLINGIGARLDLLAPLVNALDPTRPIIRFDAPGVGGSPRSYHPYRPHSLGNALVDLLDQFDINQVDVLGLSWGGAVAQELAHDHPDRCRRLVLASTGFGPVLIPPSAPVIARAVTRRRSLRPAALLASIAQDLYGGSMRLDANAALNAIREQRSDSMSTGYLLQLASITGWSSVRFLPTLRCRTLILAGDDDPLVPAANGKLLHRFMPNSTLHVYQGGHIDLISDAAVLAPVVDAFLQGE